jgi:hypothetical protein
MISSVDGIRITVHAPHRIHAWESARVVSRSPEASAIPCAGDHPARKAVVGDRRVALPVVDIGMQTAWIRAVHGVVAGERVGVGRGGGARDQERVTADEAADGRVVQARAELRDAPQCGMLDRCHGLR